MEAVGNHIRYHSNIDLENLMPTTAIRQESKLCQSLDSKTSAGSNVQE